MKRELKAAKDLDLAGSVVHKRSREMMKRSWRGRGRDQLVFLGQEGHRLQKMMM